MLKDPCAQYAYYANMLFISPRPSPDPPPLGGCDCSQFIRGDSVVVMLRPLCVCVWGGGWACVHPESFCQRRANYIFFCFVLVDEEKVNPKTLKADHQTPYNWWADNGPTLDAGLVAL